MIGNIDDEIWTPRRVGESLVEAVAWAEKSAGRVLPAGVRSGMPDPALSSDERAIEEWPAVADLEPQPLRRQFSPAQVSRMERVLQWPMRYLEGFKGREPGSYRVFKAWVICKVRKRVSFDKLCDERGWSRATAYRKRDQALAEIAQGLTRDGIKRGQH